MNEDLKSCTLASGPGTLIVLEPDDRLLKAVAMAVWQETGHFPCTANSVADAIDLIKENRRFVLAVAVGFETPGVDDLLQTVIDHSLPVVLYGEEYTDDIRQRLTTLPIADVITGERHALPPDTARSLSRLAANGESPVLVVDDSRSMRLALNRFLTNRCFKVYEAADGMEALEALEAHPEIQLVITDNEMPRMDGFTLVREIRKRYSKDDLSVIGISARTNSALSVKFITNGANDFLQKPFVKEELYCRVDHNMDMLRRIRLIRDLSNKDPLTKLYNRRYFYEQCDDFLESSQEKTIVVGMLDIDHFKKVNDTYGHDAGDDVLVGVADILADTFSEDAIVARFGGEEFCILLAADGEADLFGRFDAVRRKVARTTVSTEDAEITVTVSIGVTTRRQAVRDMTKAADALLYAAKEEGRNRVKLA